MPTWFYKHGNTEIGPFPPKVLKQLAVDQVIIKTTLVRRDDTPDWILASNVKGLIPSSQVAEVSDQPAITAVADESRSQARSAAVCIINSMKSAAFHVAKETHLKKLEWRLASADEFLGDKAYKESYGEPENAIIFDRLREIKSRVESLRNREQAAEGESATEKARRFAVEAKKKIEIESLAYEQRKLLRGLGEFFRKRDSSQVPMELRHEQTLARQHQSSIEGVRAEIAGARSSFAGFFLKIKRCCKWGLAASLVLVCCYLSFRHYYLDTPQTANAIGVAERLESLPQLVESQSLARAIPAVKTTEKNVSKPGIAEVHVAQMGSTKPAVPRRTADRPMQFQYLTAYSRGTIAIRLSKLRTVLIPRGATFAAADGRSYITEAAYAGRIEPAEIRSTYDRLLVPVDNGYEFDIDAMATIEGAEGRIAANESLIESSTRISDLEAIYIKTAFTGGDNHEREAEQLKRQQLAEKLFGSITLQPSVMIGLSKTLKEQYGASVELRGKDYKALLSMHASNDWLGVINVTAGRNHEELPEALTIKESAAKLLSHEFQLLLHTNSELVSGYKKPGLHVIGFPSYGKPNRDAYELLAHDFIALHSLGWSKHPETIGYYQTWRPSDGYSIVLLESPGAVTSYLQEISERYDAHASKLLAQRKLDEIDSETLVRELNVLRNKVIDVVTAWASSR